LALLLGTLVFSISVNQNLWLILGTPVYKKIEIHKKENELEWAMMALPYRTLCDFFAPPIQHIKEEHEASNPFQAN